jgi:cation diffusion facilitator family transporter
MAKYNKSIYAALAANVFIAVIKFVAGTFSNSAAMISEGVHSLVDTVNQLLILYGIRESKRKADAERPFGYGRELYFWSFIVSILIFGLGGGVSIYQGYTHIIKPKDLGDPTWNYIVLGTSAFFEGISLIIAIREFNKVRDGLSWWQAIRESKDPSTFLVLFEDGAAVCGLSIVAICMYLGHRLDCPYLDGIASLLVGLLLVAVSLVLARESRSLLMGEGISSKIKNKIIATAEKDPAVMKVQYILSIYRAPDDVLLMLIIAFKPDLDTADINESIVRIRTSIKEQFGLMKFVAIQPEEFDAQKKP